MPGVVVVGGGIVGLSVAHALAGRGVRRVTVLERGVCGQGATSKATGGIRTQFGEEVNVRLSLRSLEAFRDWSNRYGGDAAYRPVGYAFLATGEEPLARLRAGAEMQRRLGARVEVCGVAETARRLPGVRLDGVDGASFGADDGLGDPGAALASLLGACRRVGIVVREGTAVDAIEPGGVVAAGERLAADVVVIAAGPWSAVVGRLAGVELPVEPRHRQTYRTGASPGIPRPSPLVVDLGSGLYFHTDGDGLVFGGGDREGPATFDERVRPADAARGVELLARRLPGMREAPLTGIRAGLREMTPDGLGILGPLPGRPWLFAATGFSGHGFMHAPAIGEVAAALIAGSEPPFDVGAMAPARFEGETGSDHYAF